MNDLSPKQDYVLFLRFEVVGNKDGYLKACGDDTTLITSMLQKHLVTIRNVYLDDKIVYLDFCFSVFHLLVLWETCVYLIH